MENTKEKLIAFLKNRINELEKQYGEQSLKIGELEGTISILNIRLEKTGTDVSLEAQKEAFRLIELKDIEGLWNLLTEHFSPTAWLSEKELESFYEELK